MATFSPFNWFRSPQVEPPCRTALSVNPSLDAAVQDISEQLRPSRQSDLALVFASTSYASDLPRLLPLLKHHLNADLWLGCVGGGVVGTGTEVPSVLVGFGPSGADMAALSPEAIIGHFDELPAAVARLIG